MEKETPSHLLYSKSFSEEVLGEFRDTIAFRNVVFSFVLTSLRQKYRRSILGYFWSLLSPVLNYGIIAWVFSTTTRVDIPNYFAFVFFAALSFGMISSSLILAPNIMINHESYLKKIYVPKLVFVLRIVGYEVVNFLLSFVGVVLLCWLLGQLKLSWALLFLPLALGTIATFLVGASAILAVISVFYRDFVHILPVAMQALLFLTPIYYTPEMAPPELQKVIYLNPFYYFINLFRAPLYASALPPIGEILLAMFIALFTFVVGIVTLAKYNNRIVFKL